MALTSLKDNVSTQQQEGIPNFFSQDAKQDTLNLTHWLITELTKELTSRDNFSFFYMKNISLNYIVRDIDRKVANN